MELNRASIFRSSSWLMYSADRRRDSRLGQCGGEWLVTCGIGGCRQRGCGVSDAGGSANNIGGYRMQTMLAPWQGYWVKATRPLTLIIPPPTQTIKASAISWLRQVICKLLSRLLEPIWQLQLVASCSSSIDIDNFIGEAQGLLMGATLFGIGKNHQL